MEIYYPDIFEAAAHIVVRGSFIGAILGGIASAVVGGLLSKSSAKTTNQSNQAIAKQETETNISSAREANALTELLAGRATASTEKMSERAISATEGMAGRATAATEGMARRATSSTEGMARRATASTEGMARRATSSTEGMAARATASTEAMHNRAIKSTEGMTASALALSKSQFDQSQAFSERMSNTAYTRGIKDLKNAGLNPILAATRGVTSTPSVHGGPAPSGQGSAGSGTGGSGTGGSGSSGGGTGGSGASGSGTGGSGTGGHGAAARASQFRRVDEGLQALNSAAAIGRVVEEIQSMRLANDARQKFGKGSLADKAETIAKTSTSVKKRVKTHFLRPAAGAAKKLIGVTKGTLRSLRSQGKKNEAARGPRSTYQLFGPPSRKRR